MSGEALAMLANGVALAHAAVMAQGLAQPFGRLALINGTAGAAATQPWQLLPPLRPGGLGPNDLPYALPIHPNLVHLTIGLFVIAIAFDLVGALYPVEKRLFRFLALPVTRSGFHDVGWYNLLVCAAISFLTVAAGFYEMLLADPVPGVRSALGLDATTTLLWHGVGGVLLLMAIVAMAVWRGFQRFVWRRDYGRQVQWSYLLVGVLLFAVLGLHGTLGAELAAEFGVHVSADQLLAEGLDPRQVLP